MSRPRSSSMGQTLVSAWWVAPWRASPKRLKRIGREAHKLSDLLGDDHDLAVLLDRAHSQPELFTPGELELLVALAERRSDVLRRKALRRAKRLYRRKPRKLLRKIALG